EAFDGVIADNRVLSRHLVTESSVAEIVRVLKPGGRALLVVDSVVLGMALLAEQDRWPELSHAPSADVLLVPWPDGSLTRCFTAEQLTETLTEAGLELEWVKPRTVLSASTVEMMLARDPRSMGRLVETELRATEPADSVGVHLVAGARKPDGELGARTPSGSGPPPEERRTRPRCVPRATAVPTRPRAGRGGCRVRRTPRTCRPSPVRWPPRSPARA